MSWDRVNIAWNIPIPADYVVRSLLELAAASVAIPVAAVAPTLARHLDQFVDAEAHRRFRPNSVLRALRRIEERGLVRRVTVQEGQQLQLTSAGRSRLDQIWVGDLALSEPPESWDGQWRLVIFDVPEERRYLRGVFRRKLQQLGFKYLQKSVWIYPFTCEQVLTELAGRLGLKQHIHVGVLSELSSDALVRDQFALPRNNLAAGIPKDEGEASAPGSASREEVTEKRGRPKLSSVAEDEGESLNQGEQLPGLELIPIDELD